MQKPIKSERGFFKKKTKFHNQRLMRKSQNKKKLQHTLQKELKMKPFQVHLELPEASRWRKQDQCQFDRRFPQLLSSISWNCQPPFSETLEEMVC